MEKYSQDKDEQLQRFRKAMPKDFWWTDQVKTCKSIKCVCGPLNPNFDAAALERRLVFEPVSSIARMSTGFPFASLTLIF